MSIETWMIYIATVLALMSTPGPSQLLMLSNSAAHGFSRSLATAAGDLTANALQMLVASLGLAAIIAASGTALAIVKWVGGAYLIWLGVRMIRRAPPVEGDLAGKKGPAPLAALWMQGFLTSAANPKAVVFFAALFSQFILPESPFWPQLLILSATYILIDGAFLSACGAGAGWLARLLGGRAKARVARIGGGCMITAAILLGLKSASRG